MTASRPSSGTTIAFAGDWHGDRVWANARLEGLGQLGIRQVIHAGDFGIWPGPTGKRYLSTVEGVCSRYSIELLVVPGNHEDWGRLTALWSRPKHQSEDGHLLPLWLTEHVAVLPAGWRWETGGRSFVALGGAASVDRERRTAGRDWWPEEQITEADVEATARGGYADVMVTHESPAPPWATPKVATIIERNPSGWPADALAYASVSTDRVTRAFLAVRPRLMVHGHFHVFDQATVRLPDAAHGTTMWSLSMNGQGGNVRLLDLTTLTEPMTGTP